MKIMGIKEIKDRVLGIKFKGQDPAKIEPKPTEVKPNEGEPKAADVPIVVEPKKDEPKVEDPKAEEVKVDEAKVEDVGTKVKGIFDALSDDEKNALLELLSPKEEVKAEDVQVDEIKKEEIPKADEAKTLLVALSKRVEQLEKVHKVKGAEAIPIIKGEAAVKGIGLTPLERAKNRINNLNKENK